MLLFIIEFELEFDEIEFKEVEELLKGFKVLLLDFELTPIGEIKTSVSA